MDYKQVISQQSQIKDQIGELEAQIRDLKQQRDAILQSYLEQASGYKAGDRVQYNGELWVVEKLEVLNCKEDHPRYGKPFLSLVKPLKNGNLPKKYIQGHYDSYVSPDKVQPCETVTA